MISIIAEIKQRIQQAIEVGGQYFLPIAKKQPEPTPEEFTREAILAEPSEVLDWLKSFLIDQNNAGLKGLIESLVEKTCLRITAFTSFAHSGFQLSFNTESSEGFLRLADIEVGEVQLGDLIDITEIGLSVSYRPESTTRVTDESSRT